MLLQFARLSALPPTSANLGEDMTHLLIATLSAALIQTSVTMEGRESMMTVGAVRTMVCDRVDCITDL